MAKQAEKAPDQPGGHEHVTQGHEFRDQPAPAMLPGNIPLPAGVTEEQFKAMLPMLALMAQTMQGLNAGPIQDTLEAQAFRRKQDADFEKFKAWVSLSLEEKNNLTIRQRYGDGPRWYECHLDKREKFKVDQPCLKIPAHSAEEADGRYRQVCGINSLDGRKIIVTELAAS